MHLLEDVRVDGAGLEGPLDAHPAHEGARAARDLLRRDPERDVEALREAVDQSRDRVEEALAALRDGAAQLLAARRVRPELEQEGRPPRLVAVRLEEEARDDAIGVLDALLVEEELGVRPPPLLEVRVQDGQEEVVLAREARVDGALRVAGLLRDQVERRAVEPVAEERLARARHEVGPRALLPLDPRQALGYHRYLNTIGI
jgi:hypothetical protein